MQKEPELAVYKENRMILSELRKKYTAGEISRRELLVLRGQVLSGDADGAVRGLAKIMRGKLDGKTG